MKKILIVTGGAGFVGSNLIKYLLAKTNFKILSIDNYSSGLRKNHIKNTVEITSQNHGFCIDENIKDNIQITHTSLNDNTVEGIKATNYPAFSVQYHPESSPGPHDSRYLFNQFIKLIDKSHAKKK